MFKSFHAQFIKRPESDVHFVCTQGDEIKAMVEKSKASGERINKVIKVNAYTNYLTQPELVAELSLELSIKVV